MDQTKQNLTSSIELLSHPGETLQELLDTNGISQKELAARLDVSPKHVNEIISGKKGITSSMAHKLANVFTLSAEFWNALQSNYDEAVHKIKDEENVSDIEIDVAKRLHYDELHEWGYLQNGSRSNVEKTIFLRKFMGVTNLIQIIPTIDAALLSPKPTQAFMMSTKTKCDKYSLAVWLRMCTFNLQKLGTLYDRNKLKALLPEIKKQILVEDINVAVKSLTDIFAANGIDFAVIHNIVGAPVQGYIRLLEGRVILRITLRYCYEDIFWFALFHEIGHLLSAKDTKEAFIDFSESQGEQLSSENEANDFAEKCLLDKEKMMSYFKEYRLSSSSIRSFAQANGITPGIVVGQLGHTNPRFFQQYSKLRRKIVWSK